VLPKRALVESALVGCTVAGNPQHAYAALAVPVHAWRFCVSSRLFLKRFVAWAVAFAGGCVVGGVSVMSGVVTTVGPFQAAMVAIWCR
jgi:hypothetical protein